MGRVLELISHAREDARGELRAVKRVHVNAAAVRGSPVATPVVDDPDPDAIEIVIHPDDFAALEREEQLEGAYRSGIGADGIERVLGVEVVRAS